jgi:hypothetical protein
MGGLILEKKLKEIIHTVYLMPVLSHRFSMTVKYHSNSAFSLPTAVSIGDCGLYKGPAL